MIESIAQREVEGGEGEEDEEVVEDEEFEYVENIIENGWEGGVDFDLEANLEDEEDDLGDIDAQLLFQGSHEEGQTLESASNLLDRVVHAALRDADKCVSVRVDNLSRLSINGSSTPKVKQRAECAVWAARSATARISKWRSALPCIQSIEKTIAMLDQIRYVGKAIPPPLSPAHLHAPIPTGPIGMSAANKGRNLRLSTFRSLHLGKKEQNLIC